MSQTTPICFVTGASSGVGAAIAKHLARPGTKLILQGRNASRLDEIAEACRRSGAEVEISCGDLSDNNVLLQLAASLDGILIGREGAGLYQNFKTPRRRPVKTKLKSCARTIAAYSPGQQEATAAWGPEEVGCPGSRYYLMAARGPVMYGWLSGVRRLGGGPGTPATRALAS